MISHEQDRLAETIWNASRADEGSISATGALHVAAAILAAYDVTPKLPLALGWPREPEGRS